ncbi:MAG: DUF1465 family protein [Maricaulaceae bacterium]
MSDNRTAALNILPAAKAARITDFAGSELFARTFREGMALVEETAAYLDGPGREASKTLPREAALAYAGESMRLTTRLMQISSWLLVQRAVLEEEMSPAEANQDKYRLGAEQVCRGDALGELDDLPSILTHLLERSERLYERVFRLDRQLFGEEEIEPANPVNEQITDLESRLSAAFGGV